VGKKHIAIDLGAESGRIIVGDVSFVKVVHRFSNLPVRVGNTLYWDVLSIFSEIKTGLKLAFSSGGPEIRSIGLDTWGVDFALCDAGGELLSNPYHYRDSRTDGVPEEVFSVVPRAEVYGQTGIQIMQINSLYQLLAFKREHPELYAAADHLLFTPDLFHYWLTGVMKNEYSIASTSQMYNVSSRQWAAELLSRLGLDGRMLGEVVMPGTVLGPLLPALAEEVGAPDDVKVVAVGSHDTASAVAAVPAGAEKNYAYISSGTWSLLGIESPEPVITEKSLTYNFTNEGATDGGIRFLKNIMGLWIVQECKREWDRQGSSYSYAELAQMAQEYGPAAFSIEVNDPRFLKPGSPHDTMPDRVTAWCTETGQTPPDGPAQVVRGILESLATEYRRTIERIEDTTGSSISELYIIGGGSQNELLCQLAADATGVPVYAGPTEATAIGNLMTQQVALGEIESFARGRELVRSAHDIKKYLPRG